ncbi:MAG: hypothetical protein WC521_06290 [Bdellovibrionales bacterium]|jgi:hypothetical protein
MADAAAVDPPVDPSADLITIQRITGVEGSLAHLGNVNPLHFSAFKSVCRKSQPRLEPESVHAKDIQVIGPDTFVSASELYAAYITTKRPDGSLREIRGVTRYDDKSNTYNLREISKKANDKLVILESSEGIISINSVGAKVSPVGFFLTRVLLEYFRSLLCLEEQSSLKKKVRENKSQITLPIGKKYKSPLTVGTVLSLFPSEDPKPA